MNEYEITHTPKVGPAKEPSNGMAVLYRALNGD